MTNLTRRELYMAVNQLHPDEIVGATDLDCENDLRGITGNAAYEIKGYCSQKKVDRCHNCSLYNYGRDCHNNPAARK
jgi:hypothetical protein